MPAAWPVAPSAHPGAWPRLLGPCEVCRRWSPATLCADCVARFGAPRPRCARCGLALGAASAACGACLREPPPFEHTVCAVDYRFPWDGLITEFKFQGRVELAAALGRLLAAAVCRADAPRPALLLPVPLADARLRERGYDQAWALARVLARALGLPAEARLLQRPLATVHQATLDRAARQRNLRAAFMVDPRRRPAVQGQRIALVDDVMTTGATVREAASALLRAGAAAVDVWVVARTPADAGAG